MAKIVFPGITITPVDETIGASTTTKPKVRIPHIVGDGTNGIAVGLIAKPVVTGVNSIVTTVGSLLDHNGLNGKVWRMRVAVDIDGNVAPGTAVMATTITDITPALFPVPAYTDVQFAPATLVNSKFYKFEIEDELEYVTYSAVSGGDES